jgi:hypothetical protein
MSVFPRNGPSASKPCCAGDGRFEALVKLKLSIELYQQRLDTNSYSSDDARKSDLTRMANSIAELALTSLCDNMHLDSANTVKQAAKMNLH